MSAAGGLESTGGQSQADVIVVGGGIAGMAAAVRSAEHGLRVIVLERGQGPYYPCNTRYSSGIIHVAYRDPKRDGEELSAIVSDALGEGANPNLIHAYTSGASGLIDWLHRQGVAFVRFGAHETYRWCMAPPRPSRPGLEWKGYGADVMLGKLALRLKELGGTIMLGTTAQELVARGGRCAGVVAETGNRLQDLATRAVVLADGGFQANAEEFHRNIGSDFNGVLQRGAATGRGDGLRMATALGAAETDLSCFYGHLLGREALSNGRLWPYPTLDEIAAAAIVVGTDGRRFVDEGLGGIAIANHVARLPDPLSAMVIFDEAIWQGPGKAPRVPANPQFERFGGTVVRAESIEALAGELGLPAEPLAQTITCYNEAVWAGRPEMLVPSRRTSSHRAMLIERPPFMAIRACAGITYTMGGIAIDACARVVDRSGHPIAGLYAAGATTGGLEGGVEVAYVGGLSKSGTLGLIAADNLAAWLAADGGK